MPQNSPLKDGQLRHLSITLGLSDEVFQSYKHPVLTFRDLTALMKSLGTKAERWTMKGAIEKGYYFSTWFLWPQLQKYRGIKWVWQRELKLFSKIWLFLNLWIWSHTLWFPDPRIPHLLYRVIEIMRLHFTRLWKE